MQKLISLCILSLNLLALETIAITDKQQIDLGVKTQPITKIQSINFGPYNGIVVLDKKDIISLSPKIDSVVESIYVRELEHVKKGQKLLSFTSNTLLALQEAYLEALFTSQSANQDYERNMKLESEGIISNKRLLSSKKTKRSSDLKVSLTARNLLINGFTRSMLARLKKNSEPIYTITKYASRSGLIRKVNVNIGEYIASDKKMIEIYADGERFIEITVPVKNISNISITDNVNFADFKAKVTAIGSIVNTASQSIIVRAKIQDTKNIMINRVYEVNLAKKVTGVYKIKKTALVFNESESLVFRKNAQGFEVLEVSIVKEGPVCYIVRADLRDGDELAATSTAALLSAMDSGDE
ncbi:MAG: efflux RND transporter periplasmic adaptor subunit [Sulfurimonas sp.]|nr:efflux RND transporter periplasmic adaptor subunit [Sulfurimonas sp.]MDQ7059757.1 efflux RND transporter periplasmic adaptor subunit [Sulfurimonas sp.]